MKIPWWRKIAYALLALLILAAAAEGVMRLVGWAYLQRARTSAGDGDRPTILCLGDSFTFGIGAGPNESYPDHLAHLVGDQWRVINGGHPYMDSTSLLASFSSRLLANKPLLVVLMIGYNNQFRVGAAIEDIDFEQWLYQHFGGLKLVQLLHILRVNRSVDKNVAVVAEIPPLTQSEMDRVFAHPDNAAVHAVFKRRHGDYDRLLADPATDPDTLLAKGLVYLTRGEGRTAEPLFFQVLNRRPDDQLALMGAGYITLYRREIVMGFVKEEFDARRPWLQAGMATVLMDRGELARAEELMRGCVRVHGWFVEGFVLLARLHLAQSDPAEALFWLRRAEAGEPLRADIHWLRGEALLTLQNWPEAKTSFDRAFENAMDHPSYYARLRRYLAARPADPDDFLREQPAAYTLAPAADIHRRFSAYAREKLAGQSRARTTENLADDVRQMSIIADNLGVKLVLMSYPGRFNYQELKEIAVAYDLPFVDHVPVFEQALSATPPDRLFRPDGHCTGAGYHLMAQNLLAQLQQLGLLTEAAHD
ncbi:MAG: GDSL-type esterase/lipase family protein [Alphaproteobacteria bacterium]